MFHLVEKVKNKIREKRWSPLERDSFYATNITFGNKTSFFSYPLIFSFIEKSTAVTLFVLYSSIFNLQLVRKVGHFPCDNPA